jgi:hypothetical protein
LGVGDRGFGGIGNPGAIGRQCLKESLGVGGFARPHHANNGMMKWLLHEFKLSCCSTHAYDKAEPLKLLNFVAFQVRS